MAFVFDKLIKEYAVDLQSANNEEAKKQRLNLLLSNLFKSQESQAIINSMTLGAEKKIVNIVRKGKKSDKGAADSQYERIIIEFEKSLKFTRKKAIEQLQDYLFGNWNSGDGYHFTLIASDCGVWEIYAPTEETIEGFVTGKIVTAENILLEKIDEIEASEKNTSDFYFFLDRYLFKTEPKKATLDSIKRDFGTHSNTFKSVYDDLFQVFSSVSQNTEVEVAFNQWKRFLSIAYSEFDASPRIFIIHTYLSIFAKLLAYEFLSKDDFIDDNELEAIISGEIFESRNIKNFTDNDFFHWVISNPVFSSLKPSIREIAQKVSEYDFTSVDEDILKGVYQELIDRDTRLSLGEYYTPDWLCEKIVNEISMTKGSRVLDPSCGSGSFLRAAVASLKSKFHDLSAEDICNQVCGIDIHPLSVLIAKTTLLLALGDKLALAKKPLLLNVYLADTLLTPPTSVSLDMFGDEFTLWIDDKAYKINTCVFNDIGFFDEAVTLAEDIAEITKSEKVLGQEAFTNSLKSRIKRKIDINLVNSFYNIYVGLHRAKVEQRDSIWKFIVLNLYKPCFFQKSFDFVIGNPPWFTYSSIKNSDYQNRLKDFAAKYKLVPNVANMPHLEIAAIFLAHSTNYFLKDSGKLAFVLPRSFLSADHHDSTRMGKTDGVRITEIWDLDKVSPLFNVPSCVLFTQRAYGNMKRPIPKSGCEGKVFSGRLKAHNLNLASAKPNLNIESTKFYINKLGRKTAFSTSKKTDVVKPNHYEKLFHQGATIVPRKFYFVDIIQGYQGELQGRILTVKSSESMEKDAKEPWKSLPPLEGRVNTDYLFKTAIARNILPFYLHNPETVLLPATIKNCKLELHTDKDLLESGELEMAKWFKKVQKLWDENKTEKNAKITSNDWINYQSKLTSQDFSKRYLVLYSASAKDANAVVFDRESADLDFIVESKAYCYFTNSKEEAHFVCAFLNSNIANETIKDFQSRGLFGARDVHKTILTVPFPKYDPANQKHIVLADLGIECAASAKKIAVNTFTSKTFSNHELGRSRMLIKQNLHAELAQIDKLVALVSKS